MKYATLITGSDLKRGTVSYSMPYDGTESTYRLLSEMIEKGWVVKSTSIEPGHLGSHGYRNAQFIFLLEKPSTEAEEPNDE